MSSRDWLFRLEDILDALRLVQQYIKNLDFQQFESDQRTRNAVIRNLEIIGEAARHIPDFIVREYPNIPWRHIRDMRNILIHEYFGIDMEIIWQTVVHDLPFLQSQLEQIKTDNSPRNSSLFNEQDD